jgi:hypothetical protein
MEQDHSAHKYGHCFSIASPPYSVARPRAPRVRVNVCPENRVSRIGAIPRIARVAGSGALDSVLVRRDESPGSSPRDPFR